MIPEIVDWEAGGKDAAGMRYDRLTVYAVEAIKQLHADLKKRDSEIAVLRKRIEQLENAPRDPQSESAVKAAAP